MLTKETLQTALENVEAYYSDKYTKMGHTEQARYKRVIAELKDTLAGVEVDNA